MSKHHILWFLAALTIVGLLIWLIVYLREQA